ncbi:hypothetical protein FM038_003420 [Shewanella eurypsychrophilus]|uniref:Uncharacterized protein n=1 Tax=Shewanella eurypsychrophilus TaxID=2593656 RepID=A0ABX6V428_9GAMM|nr:MULTISPECIES: hypothetical protein [Shewanella]QFU21288.1 hypothetical protein FS418_05000 [Shewanella sp. YLB-09]QPG56579.1 hypothetical protein FM038_003420 [Shewanella eurypsychrophilus]
MKRHTATLKRLLEDKVNPFSYIYTGVSEQVLILSMTARSLYLNPSYKKWFDDYSAMLEKATTFDQSRSDKPHSRISPQNKSAEQLMHGLFEYHDLGRPSLDYYTEQYHYASNKLQRANVEALKNSIQHLKETVIKGVSDPIPFAVRLGYNHENLLTSILKFDKIREVILDFQRDINVEEILSESLFYTLKNLNNRRVPPPFAKHIYESLNFVPNEFSVNDLIPKADRQLIISYLNDNIEDIFTYSESKHVDINIIDCLLSNIHQSYAMAVSRWINKISKILIRTNAMVEFDWSYETIESNNPFWNPKSKYVCNIKISRETLQNLIESNQIHHAAFVLAECLSTTYKGDFIKDEISKDKENNSTSEMSNSLYAKRVDNLAYVSRLLAWFEESTILFSDSRKPMSIKAILSALECFDTKHGIQNNKTNVTETYKNISLRDDISEVTVKRNHSKITRQIKTGLQDKVEHQKDKNRSFPSAEASNIFKPLWDNYQS